MKKQISASFLHCTKFSVCVCVRSVGRGYLEEHGRNSVYVRFFTNFCQCEKIYTKIHLLRRTCTSFPSNFYSMKYCIKKKMHKFSIDFSIELEKAARPNLWEESVIFRFSWYRFIFSNTFPSYGIVHPIKNAWEIHSHTLACKNPRCYQAVAF